MNIAPMNYMYKHKEVYKPLNTGKIQLTAFLFPKHTTTLLPTPCYAAVDSSTLQRKHSATPNNNIYVYKSALLLLLFFFTLGTSFPREPKN